MGHLKNLSDEVEHGYGWGGGCYETGTGVCEGVCGGGGVVHLKIIVLIIII